MHGRELTGRDRVTGLFGIERVDGLGHDGPHHRDAPYESDHHEEEDGAEHPGPLLLLDEVPATVRADRTRRRALPRQCGHTFSGTGGTGAITLGAVAEKTAIGGAVPSAVGDESATTALAPASAAVGTDAIGSTAC